LGYSVFKINNFSKQKELLMKTALYILFFFYILINFSYGQTPVSIPAGPNATVVRYVNASGNVVYDMSGGDYDDDIGTRNNSINGSLGTYRSQYFFNLSSIPANATIISAKLQYSLSDWFVTNYFAVCKLSGYFAYQALWDAIGSSPLLFYDLSYNGGETSSTQDLIDAVTSNIGGTLYLGAASQNEASSESYAKLNLTLNLVYTVQATNVDITAQNNFIYGTIKVGVDEEAVQQNSPFPFSADIGQTVNLEAQNQTYGGYERVWNNYAPNATSKWLKNGLDILNAVNIDYHFQVSQNDDNATYEAGLRKNYVISRNYQTEFHDVLSQTPIYIVEQNSGQITAPDPFMPTGSSINYRFMRWLDDPYASNPRTIVPDDNITYEALYKYKTHSNNQNGYKNNNQRKFVRTPDGNLHNVYESMDGIWYELSTNSGQTWEIVDYGINLQDGWIYSEPSLSYFVDGQNKIHVFLTYRLQRNLPDDWIRFNEYVYENSNPNILPEQNIELGESNGYQGFSPVVSSANDGRTLFIWESKLNGSPEKLRFSFGKKLTSGYWEWYESGYFEFTENGASRPTVDVSIVNNNLRYHIAWIEGNDIYYCYLYPDANNQLLNSTKENVSDNNGYTKNFAPSLAAFDDVVVLSWVAFRKSYDESPPGEDDPEGDGSGDPVYLGGETKVFFRSKTNSVWSAFNSYGSNANTVSINRNSNNTFAFAWSEGSSNVNKFVRSDHLSDVFTTNTTGRHLQVGNYSNLNNMRLNSFKTSTSPYSFSLSNAFLVTAHNVTSERQGIIVRDSTVFYFSIGDILINGELAYFVDLPEELNVEDKETLNSYLISESFNLTDYSTFYYGVQYGVNDSALAAEALSGGGFVNYKVELVDDQTGEILGTFDDVTFDSENILTYTNLAYEVNTQGIGNRTCRLRLIVDDDLDFNYALVTGYDNEGSIGKRGFVQRTLNNIEVIETYDLAQNYPNPFNPSTIIKYQIPEDGVVTLKIFDILGKEVKTLVNELKSVGKYELNFDASNLASGVYIYRIKVNDFVSSKKMMLLK
jgi:hypothetical protein